LKKKFKKKNLIRKLNLIVMIHARIIIIGVDLTKNIANKIGLSNSYLTVKKLVIHVYINAKLKILLHLLFAKVLNQISAILLQVLFKMIG